MELLHPVRDPGSPENIDVLKGTGFSPYIKPAKSPRALAPEEMLVFPGNSL
jgi:hypothetical protein